jgi:UDP-N-acetylmuramoyl-tripeptide--D-alanyl-D-alanine ligase
LDLSALYGLYLEHPSVQTDTRLLQRGDIFFALKGPSFNGNHFARQAIDEKGASYAVVDEPAAVTCDRCFLVDDVLLTLQGLARHHRRQLDIPVLAITGSNGKTTTKELTAAVLRKRFITPATEGNLNNHIGVPLTLLRISRSADMAIVEMGANHQKEIAALCRIAEPTHGLITNCGKAHIEGFGGEEGVRKGKGELFDWLRAHSGIAFRNADLPYLREMARGIEKQVTYGTANADYCGQPVMDGQYLHVLLSDPEDGIEGLMLQTQLVGGYNFANVMSAVAVGLTFGVPALSIAEAIAEYVPGNSRSQWVERGATRIILDAYNANPTSMRAAIENFAGVPGEQKMLWLGAMKEMGEAERAEHEDLVKYIDRFAWKDVVLVGEEFKEVRHSHRWFPTSAEAAEWVRANPPADTTILLKGSRGSKMEVMLEALPAV